MTKTTTRQDVVVICESQIAEFLEAYPVLQRLDVMRAMAVAGPFRRDVETELSRAQQQRTRRMSEFTAELMAERTLRVGDMAD